MPRQHRHGYAADLLRGLRLDPEISSTESLPERSVRCEPAHIHQLRADGRITGLWHWFLSYTFSSRLPDPGRLAVPTRPVVVRAAPTLPRISTVRLPSASTSLLRQASGGLVSSPPVVIAPRGAPRGSSRPRTGRP